MEFYSRVHSSVVSTIIDERTENFKVLTLREFISASFLKNFIRRTFQMTFTSVPNQRTLIAGVKSRELRTTSRLLQNKRFDKLLASTTKAAKRFRFNKFFIAFHSLPNSDS